MVHSEIIFYLLQDGGRFEGPVLLVEHTEAHVDLL